MEIITTFDEWQQELDTELTKTAEGFVRIGYLLKMARDTDILKDSGYNSIVELAKARYGLDKTQVSRFIHINDRFSENGNSDRLMEQYKGFGYAKLTIMLQLPDTINEELTPEFSKADIQAVKEEIDREKEISDLEVLMEEPDVTSDYDDNLIKALAKLGEDEPELYRAIYEQNKAAGYTVEQMKDDMCPNEEKIYFVRLAGIGRMVFSLKTKESTVRLVNSRSGEKQEYTWQQLIDGWKQLFKGKTGTAQEEWSREYKRPYPSEETKEERPKERKEPKVSRPAPEKTCKEDVKKVNEEKADTEAPAPEDEDKSEKTKKPESRINTGSEADSTPKPSTQDYKGAVFNEMIGVANGLLSCVYQKDVKGIREHIKDIGHMLDTLAAEEQKDIPGQMRMGE